MTRRERFTTILCIVLHIVILLNLWNAYKLTPRILVVNTCKTLGA